MTKYKNLPLRKGVGIILLNNENKIFVGKRIDNPKNFWQMPQVGIDENESFLEAAKRELQEETGIKTIKIIKELDKWFTYDLPENLISIIWKGKYRGQKQKWFIMRFFGNNSEIDVKTKNPEFLDWKWIKPLELPNIAVNFKINLYTKLTKELMALKLN